MVQPINSIDLALESLSKEDLIKLCSVYMRIATFTRDAVGTEVMFGAAIDAGYLTKQQVEMSAEACCRFTEIMESLVVGRN